MTSVVQPTVGAVAARFRREFIAEHPDAIVFACADGRYTIVEWDVLRSLGLTRVPDYPFAPGGPGLLHPETNRNAMTRNAQHEDLRFLITGHHATRVLLIAHAGCGFYAVRCPGQNAAQIRDRQLRDLVEVQAELQRRHAGVQFDCYFAQPESGHVAIHHVVGT